MVRTRIRRTVFLTPEADEVFRWVGQQLGEFPGRVMSDALDMIAGYLQEVRQDVQKLDEGASQGFLLRSLMRRAFLGLADVLGEDYRRDKVNLRVICPGCNSSYVEAKGDNFVCGDCGKEFDFEEAVLEEVEVRE